MSRESLGKGLNALISNGPESTDRTTGITTLKIDSIVPNRYQPRKVFDRSKLAELAESLKQNGILQPIIVTKNADSEYELVAGERRLEAAKLAEIDEVPVIIRSITPQEQLQYAIIENVQREDLNAVEEAKAYQRLNEEFGLTHLRISEVVGKDRATISNLIRLLKLEDVIQNYILEGKLSSGHARAILQIPPERQLKFADLIVKNHLSVRKAEELARNSEILTETQQPVPIDENEINWIKKLENKIANKYSFKVNITRKNNRGKISFYFKSKKEMENLLKALKVDDE
jgi:ParB family transcriptional regulator, chromosome partitioning protein